MAPRQALGDEQQRQRLVHFLAGRQGQVGVTALDNRLFVDAVLYGYRQGISWRDFSERFGDFRVVNTGFFRQARPGVWFREELEARGIEPCILFSRSRKKPFNHDRALYRQRHRIESLFAKRKQWRRIATRYDRCANTFFPAICIAPTVVF